MSRQFKEKELYWPIVEKFHYLKKTELSSLPKAPGVYALASSKQILYIGKASNIKERVKNHFQQPTYRDNLFINQVSRVGYIKADSDVDALIAESRLIKNRQPKYNVMWKDDKGYFYVGITREKLPRVFLTHQKTTDIQKSQFPTSNFQTNPKSKTLQTTNYKLQTDYIGPFTEGRAIKRVLRMLRRPFPYYTARKHPKAPCQWCHLSLCPGPNPDEKAYKKNLAGMKAVLKGKRNSVLARLQRDMEKAAKEQDFERASELRDRFLALERIMFHARLFSPVGEGQLDSWTMLEKELQKLLKTKRRITRLEAYDISNIQGKEATGSQVVFLKGVPAKEFYRKYKIKIAGKSNDFAMMQELVTRRLNHPEWPYPDVMIIDGGKGQLSAALAAFRQLTIHNSQLTASQRSQMSNVKSQKSNVTCHMSKVKSHMSIFVVALAKREEELFFPGRATSVLLRDLPRPLENLFLHIRDEAHRFAISYHRHLRSKAMIRNA